MRRLFQLFILLLPTQLAYHFWPDFAFVYGIRVDYLSPTVYFTDLVWLSVLGLWIVSGHNALKKIASYKKAIFLLLILATINIYISEMPILALYKWIRVVEFLSVYIFIKSQKDVLELIKAPLMMSLLLVLMLSITQIIIGQNVGGPLYWIGERAFTRGTPGIALAGIFGREYLRPYATFAHPNALAGFALISLFLFYNKSGLMAKTILFTSAVLVFVSFSQNAWLALLVAPVIYFIAKKVKGGFIRFLTSAVVASFFLTILKVTEGAREIVQRVELNHAAGRIIAAKPIFGLGLGSFVSALPGVTSPGTLWLLQPVHNTFLLATAEAGLFGLLLLVYFIARSINPKNALAVIAIILTGLFDHYWVSIFQNMLLAAVVLGICYNDKTK